MLRYTVHDPCAIQLACIQFTFFSRFLVNAISFFYSGCCKFTSAWLWTKRKKHFTTQEPDQVGPQTLWSSMRTNSKILFDAGWTQSYKLYLRDVHIYFPYPALFNKLPPFYRQSGANIQNYSCQTELSHCFLSVCAGLEQLRLKNKNDFFGPLKGLESIISVTILWMVNSFSTLGFFATVNYVIELLQTKTTIPRWNLATSY